MSQNLLFDLKYLVPHGIKYIDIEHCLNCQKDLSLTGLNGYFCDGCFLKLREHGQLPAFAIQETRAPKAKTLKDLRQELKQAMEEFQSKFDLLIQKIDEMDLYMEANFLDSSSS